MSLRVLSPLSARKIFTSGLIRFCMLAKSDVRDDVASCVVCGVDRTSQAIETMSIFHNKQSEGLLKRSYESSGELAQRTTSRSLLLLLLQQRIIRTFRSVLLFISSRALYIQDHDHPSRFKQACRPRVPALDPEAKLSGLDDELPGQSKSSAIS